MLNYNQVIDRVRIKLANESNGRYDIMVSIVGEINSWYGVGDYYPSTKQTQFYGARLTKKQAISIFNKLDNEC